MTEDQKEHMVNASVSKCWALSNCNCCSTSLQTLCKNKSFEQFTDDELIAAYSELCVLTKDKPCEAHDAVEHPAHYNQGGIECIDAIKAATVGKKGIEAVCAANAIKYLWRYEAKNGIEDVKKARWYIDRLIRELEEKNQ